MVASLVGKVGYHFLHLDIATVCICPSKKVLCHQPGGRILILILTPLKFEV